VPCCSGLTDLSSLSTTVSEERRIIFGALRKKNENVREKKKRASKEGKKTCQNIVSSRNPIPNRFKYDVP
jgi:hypothetical protein